MRQNRLMIASVKLEETPPNRILSGVLIGSIFVPVIAAATSML
jgi:hypothetical protein